MKTTLFVVLALVAGGLTATAQSQRLDPTLRTRPDGSSESRILTSPRARDEIQRGRYSYGGLGVDIYKERNPARLLLNPDEPKEKNEGNLARDSSGKILGIKFLTIRF